MKFAIWIFLNICVALSCCRHLSGSAVSSLLRSIIVEETNGHRLEQYTSKYMVHKRLIVEDELNHVTDIMGRNMLMLSSNVHDFHLSSVNDSFYGYAFTSILQSYFGTEQSYFSLTVNSDSLDLQNLLLKNLPMSQWTIHKSMNNYNTSFRENIKNRYNLIIHLCTKRNCFFKLPPVRNCSYSSSLVELISVKTESSLPTGSFCKSEKSVVSYTPCMIGRYLCLPIDLENLTKNQSSRNFVAAALFNSSYLDNWVEKFQDHDDIPVIALIQNQKSLFKKECKSNSDMMLMSLSFTNGDSQDFTAVASSICQPGTPKQIIDTSSVGLLLKWRLHYSRSSYALLIDINAKVVIYNPKFPFIQSIPFDQLSEPAFHDVFLSDLLEIHLSDFKNLTEDDSNWKFGYLTDSNTAYDVYAHKVSATLNWVLLFLVKKSEKFRRLQPKPNVEFPLTKSAKFHGIYARTLHSYTSSYPKESPCSLFRYNVSFDSTSLFYSNMAFEDPSKKDVIVPHHGRVRHDDLTAPPRSLLRDNTQSHERLLSLLSHAWQIRAAFSHRKAHIVRRMAATSTGVYMTHPASFEPNTEWRASVFHAAFRSPGHIVASAPFLDPSGMGYVVMHCLALSHFVAVSIDLTLGYAYNGFLSNSQLTRDNATDFYLLNNHGYVVSSWTNQPLARTTSSFGQAERYHVSQMIPNLFADMLTKGFIAKRNCTRFSPYLSSRHNALIPKKYLVRFFFNPDKISSSSYPSNVVQSCVPYQIIHLSVSSDLYLIKINQTCVLRNYFCPCSIVGRTCLSCARSHIPVFSPTTCECPCECTSHLFNSAYKPKISNSCPNEHEFPFPPPIHFISKLPESNHQGAATCPLLSCNSYDLVNCSSSLGCELCRQNQKGAVAKPFCGTIKSCFEGIIGNMAPYPEWRILSHRELSNEVSSDILVPTSNISPLGLVACSIASSLVLVSILIYLCHRHRNSSLVSTIRESLSTQHLDPAATNRLLNNLDPDGCDNSPESENPSNSNDSGGGELFASISGNSTGDRPHPQQALLLAVFDQPLVQFSQAIRRPRPPASDFGYSSSMPNEDSAAEDSSVSGFAPPPRSHANGNIGLTNIADVFPSSDIFSSTGRTPSPRVANGVHSQRNAIDCL